MSKAIPEFIDLMRAATHGRHFQAAINVASMQRLSELLVDKKSQIDVDVKLGINKQNRPFIQGRATGQLSLPCQRCMEAITLDIDVSFALILVGPRHQSKQLIDDSEILVVDKVPASLIDIIEDELILSFPAVHKHDESECSALQYMQDKREAQIHKIETKKVNPFDVLKDLKLDD